MPLVLWSWDQVGVAWDQPGVTWDVPAGFITGLHLFGPDSPVSETPNLDLNFNLIKDAVNAVLVGIGTLAARPAPALFGRLYVATDQNDEWYVDDGAAWKTMGAFGLNLVVHESGNLLLLGAPALGGGVAGVLGIRSADAVPTGAPLDGATLYVADVQGVGGRAGLHHLSEDGVIVPLDPVIFRGTLVDITNTTTELTLWSAIPTVKGGSIVGRYLEVWWLGDWENFSGAPRTLTTRFKFGGTTMITLAWTIPSGSNGFMGVLYRLDLPVAGAQLGIPLNIFGISLAGVVVTPTVTIAVGAVDGAADQVCDLTAQWSFAHADLTARTLSLQALLR